MAETRETRDMEREKLPCQMATHMKECMRMESDMDRASTGRCVCLCVCECVCVCVCVCVCAHTHVHTHAPVL